MHRLKKYLIKAFDLAWACIWIPSVVCLIIIIISAVIGAYFASSETINHLTF